jgi:glycosyltransferase involved in cell wall biosynthesis
MTDPTKPAGQPEPGGRRLCVGVVPVLTGAGGGIYQYSLTMLDALPDVEPRPELVLLVGRKERALAEPWSKRGYRIESLWPTNAGWRLRHRLARITGRLGRGAPDGGVEMLPGLGTWLRDLGVDLLVLPAPSLLGYQAGVPYVLAVHDLEHRLHPEFPEVGAGGEWEARERLFDTGIRHADRILVDSEVGRRDVLTFYPGAIAPERIVILPYLPAAYLTEQGPASTLATRDELWAALDIPERYLFFPAQFWPHKNHLRVVRAIAKLRADRGIDIPVVMCGSASDPLRARVLELVRATVEELGVADLISVLGYVEDRWMAPLYANSRGVLLPTFFGNTNIPIVEAWTFGVPVLTADSPGAHEQCGDAAVLADPGSVDSIADAIRRMWSDEKLRSRVVRAGRDRLAAYGRPGYVARLSRIVADGPSERPAAAAPAALVPTVSVVVPAHNRAATIAAALDSIRAQTFRDLEIVVVDDGSTDGTAGVARSIAEHEPRLRVLEHPLNRGAQAARNTGIRAARGEWIAFLDADDTYYPESLERRLAEARRGDWDVVHSAADAIYADGTSGRFPIPPFRGNVYRDLLLAPAPMFQTLLVRREALHRIGLLDEAVPAYQEWDTSVRLAARHRFGYVEEPTCLYDRRTPGAISHDKLRGANGYEYVVRKHRRAIARVAGLRSLGDQYRIVSTLRLRAADRRGALRCVVVGAFFYPLSVRKTFRHLRACLAPLL